MKIVFFREVNKMLTKKKKIFILVGMVALLVVTGCLNLFLTRTDENVPTANYSSTTFLSSYRESKFATRQSMIDLYKSIIHTSTNQEEITETNALIKELAARMEEETNLESMIMASGYEDAVVTNVNGEYTILVKSDNFTSDDMAKILSIIVMETGASATSVKIASV